MRITSQEWLEELFHGRARISIYNRAPWPDVKDSDDAIFVYIKNDCIAWFVIKDGVNGTAYGSYLDRLSNVIYQHDLSVGEIVTMINSAISAHEHYLNARIST